jgi:hypothetical protein
MKSLLGLLAVMLIGFAVAMWYFNKGAGSGPRWSLPMALAAGEGDQQEFHAGVLRDMIQVERQRVLGEHGWEQWIAEHLELRERDGEQVPLTQAMHSAVIPADRAGHPEFYVLATVKQDRTYVFDFIPVKNGDIRLRGEFTVPPGGVPFERLILERIVVD